MSLGKEGVDHVSPFEYRRILADLFEERGVIHVGHFIGHDGQHLREYINKNRILNHEPSLAVVVQMFTHLFKDLKPDTVVGPATGGGVLARAVAEALSLETGRDVVAIELKKDEGGVQRFQNNDDELMGERVLAIDDVVNAGGSMEEVLHEVISHGGNVIAVTTIINRNPDVVGAEFFNSEAFPMEVVFTPLISKQFESYYDGDPNPPEWIREPIQEKPQ